MPLPLLAALGLVAGGATGAAVASDKDVIPGIDPFTDRSKPSMPDSLKSKGVYQFGEGSGSSTRAANETSANGEYYGSPAYTGGGGGINPQYAEDAKQKAATIGAIQQQIDYLNSQMQNLGGYERTGLNQIGDAYNKNYDRLNQQQSRALSGYATQRGDTRADFQTSTTDIDSQARNNYQALMSLLGRSGAGSSSAAETLTPYAVSQDASKTRGEVSNVYGRNLRDLDTAEDETKQSYSNSVNDLRDQKRSSTAELKQKISQQRADFQGKLAESMGNKTLAEGGDWNTAKSKMQNHLSQRDSTEKALANLLDQYRNPYKVQDVKVKQANLKNYAVDANGVKVEDSEAGSDTDTSEAYMQKIRDEEERKKGAAL